MSVTVNMNIVITYSLAILVGFHSYKFRGAFKTLILFFGSWIVGGCVENINDLFGGYYYPGSEFTIFLYRCPFDVVLGWFIIIYCSSYIAHIIVGKGRGSLPAIGIGSDPKNGVDKQFLKDTFIRAALAGYIAVSLDFFIDPVAVENGWWIWTINNIYIIGVPLGNYIGWFLLIFWACVFYDIIVTYCTVENKKKIITAGIWAGGTILASLLTGLPLEGLTTLFGLDGVRTDDRNALDTTLTPARIEGLIIITIILLISIGLILASSLAPNKMPETRPTGKIWRILPPVLMLVFWAMIMVVAVLTSALMIAVGILFCIPYFWINGYLIKNPYMD